NGLCRFDRQYPRPGAMQRLNSADADRRHVKAAVLLWFSDFNDDEGAPPGQLAGPGNRAIGPLYGFYRKDCPITDRDTLAHIEPAHFLGELPTEADIFHFAVSRSSPSQHAVSHEQLRTKIEGRSTPQPAPVHLINHRQKERVVAVILPAAEVPESDCLPI